MARSKVIGLTAILAFVAASIPVDVATARHSIVRGVLKGRVQWCQSLPPGRCVPSGKHTLVALCTLDGHRLRRTHNPRGSRFTFRVRPGRYIVAERGDELPEVLDWRRVRVRRSGATHVTMTSDYFGHPVPPGQPSGV